MNKFSIVIIIMISFFTYSNVSAQSFAQVCETEARTIGSETVKYRIFIISDGGGYHTLDVFKYGADEKVDSIPINFRSEGRYDRFYSKDTNEVVMGYEPQSGSSVATGAFAINIGLNREDFSLTCDFENTVSY